MISLVVRRADNCRDGKGWTGAGAEEGERSWAKVRDKGSRRHAISRVKTSRYTAGLALGYGALTQKRARSREWRAEVSPFPFNFRRS